MRRQRGGQGRAQLAEPRGHSELENRAEPKVTQVVLGVQSQGCSRPRAASGTDSPCSG